MWGIGVDIGQFSIDYSKELPLKSVTNRIKWKGKRYKFNTPYQTWTLTLGYKFSFKKVYKLERMKKRQLKKNRKAAYKFPNNKL